MPFITRKYHPDRRPNGLHVASDEFVGGISGSWAWGNQDAATDTAEFDTAFMDSGDAEATTTDGVNVRVLTSPSAVDFMVATKMHLFGTSNFNVAGIYLCAGNTTTPTDLRVISVFSSTNNIAFAFSSKTAYNSAYTSISTQPVIFNSTVSTAFPIYLAAQYTASTKVLTSYYSLDGMRWQAGSATSTLTNHPTLVGRFVDSQSAVNVVRSRFYWFRTFTGSEKWASATALIVGR